MRTSTYLQNTERQVEKLEDGWRQYVEKGVSGKTPFTERPQGRKLIADAECVESDQFGSFELNK